MNYFEYKGDELYCEEVPLSEIAQKEGTPLYVYSKKTLMQHYHAFDSAFDGIDHIVCYSVKVCSNVNILKLFAKEGAGMDIVSGGELFRSLNAGVDPKKIVYSGVGKSYSEIIFALKSDILMFNVESGQEIERINEIAGNLGVKGRIAIRVNPDVDPKTHPYISTGMKENKFGINIKEAFDEYLRASRMENIEVIGISCHIGSQLLDVTPFIDALSKVTELIDRLRGEGLNIKYLDIGGGLGITYDDEDAPHPRVYGEKVVDIIRDLGCTLILEPGRVIAGNAGILLSKVLYTKVNESKNFVIIDAAMNDLVRPSFYGSFHDVRAVDKKRSASKIEGDIVGPICESGDFIAKDREIPGFQPEDLVCIMSAGGYGFSMSSNYNSRVRAAEVLVDGDKYKVINKRETYEDLIKGEV
jgi:diaminopimelate decarboxylase